MSEQLDVVYLNKSFPPVDEQKKNFKPSKSNNKVLSKRKMKRQRYARFQKLHSKTRKVAFETLYNNNSIDEELDPIAVFSFWNQL